jgi:hypothetical protein
MTFIQWLRAEIKKDKNFEPTYVHRFVDGKLKSTKGELRDVATTPEMVAIVRRNQNAIELSKLRR